KSLIIVQVLKQKTKSREELVKAVLELWYSSTICSASLKIVTTSISDLLESKCENNEVESLLRYWQNSHIVLSQARQKWLLGKHKLASVINLTRLEDRQAYCQYALTGDLFKAT